MKSKIVFTVALLTVASLAFGEASWAQTNEGKAPPPAKADKAAPAEKPKADIDSFFEEAEKQTRNAQDDGNSNCVPKPIDQTPVEPVT